MSEHRRPFVVEFLGLPGAGKSAVCRCVAARLRARGIAVAEPIGVLAQTRRQGASGALKRLRKALTVARECLAHPGASLGSVRAIAASLQPSPVVSTRLALNWLLLRSLLRASRRAPVALFDQGLLQALWSIALEGRNGIGRLATALAGSRDLPDAVVVVECGPDVAAARLASRHGRESRADRWSAQDHARFLRAVNVLAQVEALVPRLRVLRRPIRVMRIENGAGGDLETIARHVGGWIEDLADATPAAIPATPLRLRSRARPHAGAGRAAGDPGPELSPVRPRRAWEVFTDG